MLYVTKRLSFPAAGRFSTFADTCLVIFTPVFWEVGGVDLIFRGWYQGGEQLLTAVTCGIKCTNAANSFVDVDVERRERV